VSNRLSAITGLHPKLTVSALFSCESVEWFVGVDHLDAYSVKSVAVPIQGDSVEYICLK
jgi:hypothetical protein